MKCVKWYHFTPVQWAILIVLIALANTFTVTQRYVVPEVLRPVAYVLFLILLILALFFIVSPVEPLLLAKTLAFILGVIAIVLIVIQDVILASTLSWKAMVIFLGAVLAPFIAWHIYGALHNRILSH